MRLTCSQLTKTCSAQGEEVRPGASHSGPLALGIMSWNRLGEAVPMHGRSIACGEGKISRGVENPTKSAVFAISTQG